MQLQPKHWGSQRHGKAHQNQQWQFVISFKNKGLLHISVWDSHIGVTRTSYLPFLFMHINVTQPEQTVRTSLPIWSSGCVGTHRWSTQVSFTNYRRSNSTRCHTVRLCGVCNKLQVEMKTRVSSGGRSKGGRKKRGWYCFKSVRHQAESLWHLHKHQSSRQRRYQSPSVIVGTLWKRLISQEECSLGYIRLIGHHMDEAAQ